MGSATTGPDSVAPAPLPVPGAGSPPGWYRDPHDPRLHRFWTGRGWRTEASTGADGTPLLPGTTDQDDGAVTELVGRELAAWVEERLLEVSTSLETRLAALGHLRPDAAATQSLRSALMAQAMAETRRVARAVDDLADVVGATRALAGRHRLPLARALRLLADTSWQTDQSLGGAASQVLEDEVGWAARPSRGPLGG